MEGGGCFLVFGKGFSRRFVVVIVELFVVVGFIFVTFVRFILGVIVGVIGIVGRRFRVGFVVVFGIRVFR